MKKPFYIIFLIISISIVSCQQNFIKISDENVDRIIVNKFEKFVISYFNTLEQAAVYDFKDIANDEFNDKMTGDVQQQTYLQIKNDFGELKSVKFTGIWKKKRIIICK